MLHLAAAGGSVEIISTLLQTGVEIDATDAFGKTPLEWARWRDHADAVALLLESAKEPDNHA